MKARPKIPRDPLELMRDPKLVRACADLQIYPHEAVGAWIGLCDFIIHSGSSSQWVSGWSLDKIASSGLAALWHADVIKVEPAIAHGVPNQYRVPGVCSLHAWRAHQRKLKAARQRRYRNNLKERDDA